jgi:hypothetical protein
MKIRGTFTIDVDLDDNTIVAPDEPIVVEPPEPPVDPPEPPVDPPNVVDPGTYTFADPEAEALLPDFIFPPEYTIYQSVAEAPTLRDSAERIANAHHPDYNLVENWGEVFNVSTDPLMTEIKIGPSPTGYPNESYPDSWELAEQYKGPWALPDNLLLQGDRYFWHIPQDGAWIYTGPRTGAALLESQEGADGYGGDRHAACYVPAKDGSPAYLYEYYKLHRYQGKWFAGYCCRWDCSKLVEQQRDGSLDPPWGQTSAAADGLPILPAILRKSEYEGSRPLNHALRITLPQAACEHYGKTWPAVHAVATWQGDKKLMRMGERLRLKPTARLNPEARRSVEQAPAEIKRIVETMQTYGCILSDIGPFAITVMHDTALDYDAGVDRSVTAPRLPIRTWLWSIELTDFEVVENP